MAHPLIKFFKEDVFIQWLLTKSFIACDTPVMFSSAITWYIVDLRLWVEYY